MGSKATRRREAAPLQVGSARALLRPTRSRAPPRAVLGTAVDGRSCMPDPPIEETSRRHEDELLALPNVTAVGIGERSGEAVIKVFVARKVPASELEPGERVPSSLDGHPVDVEEIGVVEAEPRQRGTDD